MSEDVRIHFWQPATVNNGDLVWLYEGCNLTGPFLVVSCRHMGYGSNKKLVYNMLDSSTGSWHQSEKKWIRAPMEIT